MAGMKRQGSFETRRAFMAGVGALGIAGCTVGEDFVAPKADLGDQFSLGKGSTSVTKTNQTWWYAFEDSTLNKLVERGLQQNLDIRRAVARIEQSEAIRRGAGYPLSGSARVAEAKASGGGTSGRDDTGFVRAEASWTIDLFGELRREREAAGYRLDAAYADANVSRLLFLSDIASAYIDMRFNQELIRINQRVLKSRKETLDATQELAKEGGATDLEIAQSRSLVATTRANLPESRVAFVHSINRIVALLGKTDIPERSHFDIRAPQPVARTNVVKTGVPADLVRNRPDIIRAERRFAEAVALAGVAEADLYPSFQLTGNINLNYSGHEFIPTAGFLRAALDVPLFDRKERKSKVELAKARAKELRDTWEQDVVEAVEEVHNSIYALSEHQKVVKAAERAVKSLQTVLKLARTRYIDGSVSFLQVLDAERSLLNAEFALAQDRRNLAIDFVDLNVALGGSYGVL